MLPVSCRAMSHSGFPGKRRAGRQCPWRACGRYSRGARVCHGEPGSAFVLVRLPRAPAFRRVVSPSGVDLTNGGRGEKDFYRARTGAVRCSDLQTGSLVVVFGDATGTCLIIARGRDRGDSCFRYGVTSGQCGGRYRSEPQLGQGQKSTGPQGVAPEIRPCRIAPLARTLGTVRRALPDRISVSNAARAE